MKFIVSELVAYNEAILKSDAVFGVKLGLVLLGECKQLLCNLGIRLAHSSRPCGCG